MLHCDRLKALDWTIRLFQSLKRAQVVAVEIDTDFFAVDNLPSLMNAARLSCRVGTFSLFSNSEDGFTVGQVVDLLRDPTAAASNKIVVQTVWKLQKDRNA